MSRTKFHFYFRTTQFSSSSFLLFSINAFLWWSLSMRCETFRRKLLTKRKKGSENAICNLWCIDTISRISLCFAQFTHKNWMQSTKSQRKSNGGINEWMNEYQNRTIKMTSKQTQWLHHNRRHRHSHRTHQLSLQSMIPCERCVSFVHFLSLPLLLLRLYAAAAFFSQFHTI